MKNLKNNYNYGRRQANKSENKKKTNSLCRSIAEEKLNFKDGVERHFTLSGSLFVPAVDAVYVADADKNRPLVRMFCVMRFCSESLYSSFVMKVSPAVFLLKFSTIW